MHFDLMQFQIVTKETFINKFCHFIIFRVIFYPIVFKRKYVKKKNVIV